ncbi:RDD family protein [Pseudaquabacterium rugosum]|jgi:uncharacterized RDD family membrane protein YckC|uniref:RDD family protein n=1 Tax=Pseudaquabacterium rugosum TaxID=2984194 RepID=A0ABU9B883_9BURK
MTAVPPAPAQAALPLSAPTLRRRMAAFIYEGVLLFGVLMVAGLIYSPLTGQHHALQGKTGLQVFVFLVLGLYFTWLWSHGGQTVAMKAWHLRLVDAVGHPVRPARAAARYLLAWMWFVPGLATVGLAGLHGPAAIWSALLANVAGFALLSRLRADRQFWHDAVCGTRLVHTPVKPGRATAQSAA